MSAITIAYAAVTAIMLLYGLHCYAMIFLFVRQQKKCRRQIRGEIEKFCRRADVDWPQVTVQIPIYNEAEVVERVLLSAAQLDYPANRYQIQVLDDSTDETRFLVQRVAVKIREMGLDIVIIHRSNREGFKAGALANGMKTASGEYLAIFDADFTMPADYLKRTVALIVPNSNIACVQGRWGHLNRSENWLTRAQSVAIDGHFAIEQGARSYNSLCTNFCGTAGLWRKQAILDAGGWQADTLTEDLDLSYRAYLKGYFIRYDFDLVCPAEIPNGIMALKSQQKRWAKGSIETTKKLMLPIFKSDRLSLGQKLEAFLHLSHYSISLLMFVLCFLTLPMLLTPRIASQGSWLCETLFLLIVFGALAPCAMYTSSGFILGQGLFSFANFPAMLVLGTGLCASNSFAIIQGLIGHKSEFIRTPKSGSTAAKSKQGRYRADGDLFIAILEIIAGLYCAVTLWVYVSSGTYLFGCFIAAYAVGLITFGLATLKGIFTKPTKKIEDHTPEIERAQAG